MRNGTLLLIISILTRAGVLSLLCGLAFLPRYLNLKQAYDNPRLVELDSGPTVRFFYETADTVFGWLGDPMEVAQRNGGMTWSVRVLGVPFTDPVAALSVLARDHRWSLGFGLGLIVPVGLALLFGRVFCAYVCPASLLFFSIARLRRRLGRWLYFPEIKLNRGFAWGLLLGGLGAAVWLGHGVWSLLLPYFALGQTIFHGFAMGTLSVAVGSVILFAVLDLMLGRQFTCRHVCPTGRLLGVLGRWSVFAIRRDAARCESACNSCAEVCPMQISPKLDQTVDCSMCGECLVVCPTKCLSLGVRQATKVRQVLECGPAAAGARSNGSSPAESGRGLPQSKTLSRSSQLREPSPTGAQLEHLPTSSQRLVHRLLLLLVLTAALTSAHAHHFKGLPHYNYFENYPQVPQEEFLGQVGEYEMSLVVYDFQGIQREDTPDPDKVRLFLLIFNLLNNRVYQGPLKLEILDRDEVVYARQFDKAELENLYSLHRDLPGTGRYALRVTLLDGSTRTATIPFQLSTQKIHWGRWIGGGLVILIAVAAIGARRKRVALDRKEAHQRAASRPRPAAGQV